MFKISERASFRISADVGVSLRREASKPSCASGQDCACGSDGLVRHKRDELLKQTYEILPIVRWRTSFSTSLSTASFLPEA